MFLSRMINPILQSKMYGCSDKISNISVRSYVKQIDTLTAEFPAFTNYFCVIYNGNGHDLIFKENIIILLGCGAVTPTDNIDSKKNKNNKKEFSETDDDIYEIEQNGRNIIVSVGKQTKNNLAISLYNSERTILGVENKHRFSKLSHEIRSVTEVSALHITAPFNIQFLRKDSRIQVNVCVNSPFNTNRTINSMSCNYTYNMSEIEIQNQQMDMFSDKYDVIDQQQPFRKETMERYIIKSQTRILWCECSDIDSVSYSERFNILKREFREQTNSTRTFEQNDLIEAFEKFVKMNNSNYVISIQNLNAIYEWFVGIIDLVRVLFEEWNEQNPCAIAGFITPDMTINGLQQMRQGTFIIRFSTSVNKSIAISYKDITIKHK
eukprot:86776_1